MDYAVVVMIIIIIRRHVLCNILGLFLLSCSVGALKSDFNGTTLPQMFTLTAEVFQIIFSIKTEVDAAEYPL